MEKSRIHIGGSVANKYRHDFRNDIAKKHFIFMPSRESIAVYLFSCYLYPKNNISGVQHFLKSRFGEKE